MAACLCSSQASSQSSSNLLVIFWYSLRLTYSLWTWVLHGCKWRCKDAAKSQVQKLCKCNIMTAKRIWKKLFHKAWFEISFGVLIHGDTYSFRFWVPAPSVIAGYLCGTLLIIRGSARISLGYAVCRTAVCCHDNPLICNVGISRLRYSTCLPCQDLGLVRWIVISEAIFWQRLHFARMLRLKGQSCATSIYCVWTLNPWGVELSTRVSLSLTHTCTSFLLPLTI